MAVTAENIKNIIKTFGINAQDSGSTQVQIALLTHRIQVVTQHLQKFPHDFASKQGLLKMVAKRRKFLRYLQEQDSALYSDLIQKLELKK